MPADFMCPYEHFISGWSVCLEARKPFMCVHEVCFRANAQMISERHTERNTYHSVMPTYHAFLGRERIDHPRIDCQNLNDYLNILNSKTTRAQRDSSIYEHLK